MAHYLVRARPHPDLLPELAERLKERAFTGLEPFGRSLTRGLEGARIEGPGVAVWEEEDYCSPPLAQEREAVLDRYFQGIEVERVREGEAWRHIRALPRLFPDLAGGGDPEEEPGQQPS